MRRALGTISLVALLAVPTLIAVFLGPTHGGQIVASVVLVACLVTFLLAVRAKD